MRFERQSLIKIFVDAPYLCLITWFALGALAYALKLSLFQGIASSAMHNAVLFLDFSKYYIFSKIALSPDRANIFDLAVQLKWSQQILQSVHWSKFWFSEYPPYLGLFFAPLTLLSPGWSYAVWLTLTLGAANAGVWLLHRRISPSSRLATLSLCLGALASAPGLYALLLGQMNILMTALFAFWCLLPVGQKPWTKALLCSLFSLKPHYAIYALCLLLGAGERRALSAFVLIMISILLCSVAWFGLPEILSYPLLLLGGHGTGTLAGRELPAFQETSLYSTSLQGMLDWLPRPLSLSLNIALFLIAGFLCGRLCGLHKSGKAREMSLAISLLAFLVFNPHSWTHDCYLLVVVAALTLSSTSLSLPQARNPVDAAWTLLLIFFPLASELIFIGAAHMKGMRFHLLFFYLLLLLLLGLKKLKLTQPPALEAQTQP